MAGTALTTTGQDITGDFDLQSRITGAAQHATVMKSMGSGSTDWVTLVTVQPGEALFVKNTGTNSYKLASAASGCVIEWDQ